MDYPRLWQQPDAFQSQFVRQTNALWNFHSRLQTADAKKARAYMLDALRTLGFRSPRWHVGLPRLRMTEMDRRENPNRFEDLEGPRVGTTGHGDSRQYLQSEAKIASHNEAAHMNTRYQTVWHTFHRYQGFTARDRNGSRPLPSHSRSARPRLALAQSFLLAGRREAAD